MVIPNFNFAGQCEEAIRLYQQAFRAEILYLMRYADANPEDFHRELTEAQKQFVYHAELVVDGQRIMMADHLDLPFDPGTSLFLTVTRNTKEEVLQAFELMREGCTMIYPPRSTTYSSCIVVFVDRFGFRWGIMTEQTER